MLLSILAEKAQRFPAVRVQVPFTKSDPSLCHPFPSSWARQDAPVQEVRTFPSVMLMPFCVFTLSLPLCPSTGSCKLWCSLLCSWSPAASESWRWSLVQRDHQRWCQFDVYLNKSRHHRLDRVTCLYFKMLAFGLILASGIISDLTSEEEISSLPGWEPCLGQCSMIFTGNTFHLQKW